MNEKLEDPLVWHSNPKAPLQLGRKIVVVIAVKTLKPHQSHMVSNYEPIYYI